MDKRQEALDLIHELHSHMDFILNGGGDDSDIYHNSVNDASEFIQKMKELRVREGQSNE